MQIQEGGSGIAAVTARKREIAKILYPNDELDVALMRMEYRLDNGKELDLANPRDIASKLHWLKIHDRRRRYGELVDKFAVRKFVAERVGTEILNECFGVYHDPDEIDVAAFPEKFVVKATHGWDMNLLCRERSSVNWAEAKSRLREWLAVRHELRHGEWAYSLAQPRLIAEAWMEEPSGDLTDYKFFCFDGEPGFFKIDRGRASTRTQGYFGLDCKPLPFRNPNLEPLDRALDVPPNIDSMLDVARRLSAGLPFVRVDLYSLSECIRFGEMTLYPCGGNLRFEPREWSDVVGDMLRLPPAVDEV
ncbi:ATP-grasp fold amidoligase family protein [Sorangium sp. So ce363]|uniref:ATP-grasp fold amidoligase family protein n=1 Tax=Sorangium sp. So ce363 TaxID=3133304 RepID=UPI003F635B74